MFRSLKYDFDVSITINKIWWLNPPEWEAIVMFIILSMFIIILSILLVGVGFSSNSNMSESNEDATFSSLKTNERFNAIFVSWRIFYIVGNFYVAFRSKSRSWMITWWCKSNVIFPLCSALHCLPYIHNLFGRGNGGTDPLGSSVGVWVLPLETTEIGEIL